MTEGVKYGSKPTGAKGRAKVDPATPRVGELPSPEERAWADLIVRYYLTLYHRRRIMSYGYARTNALPEIDDLEVVDVPHAHNCVECGARLVVVLHGISNGRDGYAWSRHGDRVFFGLARVRAGPTTATRAT